MYSYSFYYCTQTRLRMFKDAIQFLNQKKEIESDDKKIEQLKTKLKELEIEDYDR